MRTATLIAIALALCATYAAAEVYSWKDADGKTHFSDKPPVEKEPSLKTLVLPPSGASTTAPAPAPHATPAPAPAPAVNGKAAAEKADLAAEKKRADCAKAKADLQALDERPRRTAVGKGGKFIALDGEERANEEANLQKQIEASCR